jgi:hypothetical protein
MEYAGIQRPDDSLISNELGHMSDGNKTDLDE